MRTEGKAVPTSPWTSGLTVTMGSGNLRHSLHKPLRDTKRQSNFPSAAHKRKTATHEPPPPLRRRKAAGGERRHADLLSLRDPPAKSLELDETIEQIDDRFPMLLGHVVQTEIRSAKLAKAATVRIASVAPRITGR